MQYEIEGELIDPNTGEKLPFKAHFRIKEDSNDKSDNEHQDGAVAPDQAL